MAVRRSSGRGRPNRGASQAIKKNVAKSTIKHPSSPKTVRATTQNSGRRMGGSAGGSFDQ